MEKGTPDLKEVIADLTSIKEALSKSGSIFRFIDVGGVLRSILLISGLLIAAFSAAFYYLFEHYGSFAAAPSQIKIVIFVLLGLSLSLIGVLKIRNFLQSARKISVDMTLYRLLEEVYTPQFLALVLPHTIAMVLVIIFLSVRGLDLYIVPALSLLFGLLSISLSGVFFMKEVFILGIWLIATGLFTLFTAEVMHPLAALGITFSAGFILMALFLYYNLPGEKR